MDNTVRLLNKDIRHLLSLGGDSALIPGAELARLGRRVLERADRLFPLRGRTAGEEATLCATLLMAYGCSIYGPADRLGRVDVLLRRAEAVLPLLGSDAPERARLLVWCFAEVEEEPLLAEAEAIVAGWERPLSNERQVVADELSLMSGTLSIEE